MTKMIAELIEQRFGLPSTAGHDTPAEGELTAILSHRTHRRYTDMPISEDLMQQVLAAGLSAPAKSDLQQVAILRVESPRHPPGGCRVAAGHDVGRPGGAVFGGMRQFAPHPACLRTARHPVRERPPRCFPECRERRRHGAAKSDPRGKRGRTWRMSYQRDPQSCNAHCRTAGAPRSRISAGGPLPRLAVTRGICQHAPAHGAHGSCRPLRRYQPRSGDRWLRPPPRCPPRRFPKRSRTRSSVSANHRSMAGRRTRPGRSRCPNGRILAPSFAVRVSSWISE